MLLATIVTNNEMNTSALANLDIKLYVGTLTSVKSCEITLCSSMFMVNSQFFMVNSPLLVKGLNSPWFIRGIAEAFVASLLCLCCWIFSASARELEQPLLDAGRARHAGRSWGY